MAEHLHLRWYGYIACYDDDCQLPQADPGDDMICDDPGCEGDCAAAHWNTSRRQEV